MLPASERSVPPTTPKSAPWAIIKVLEGTGKATSATSRPTPIRAATIPPLPSQDDGAVRSGTSTASTKRNRTRRKEKIAPITAQYRFIFLPFFAPVLYQLPIAAEHYASYSQE
jgi:hypothetical protein